MYPSRPSLVPRHHRLGNRDRADGDRLLSAGGVGKLCSSVLVCLIIGQAHKWISKVVPDLKAAGHHGKPAPPSLNLLAIVVAAGKGLRRWRDRPSSSLTCAGKPLIRLRSVESLSSLAGASSVLSEMADDRPDRARVPACRYGACAGLRRILVSSGVVKTLAGFGCNGLEALSDDGAQRVSDP